MRTLIVEKITVKGNRLEIDFSCDGPLKRFFKDDYFFAEYNISIENVPESLLVIPFIGTASPLAWANETQIQVKSVDAKYLIALKEVKKVLKDFYPQKKSGGSIVADKIVEPLMPRCSNSMMLSSGGIDSLATYVRHKDEKPILVCVHGADIRPENNSGWKIVLASNEKFCRRTGSQIRTVKSNFRSMLDEWVLGSFEHDVPSGWYAGVMHGLALLSLCAPLTYVDNVGKLYIASSHTREFSRPWGSHPKIDNKVRWSNLVVEHDGYDLSRQQKIELLANYIRTNYPDLFIRSCFLSIKGDNCNVCEKCSRTIVGLELAGLDPNNHGFNVNIQTPSRIKENLTCGGWPLSNDERWMWQDIKNHAYLNTYLVHPEFRTLLDWLSQVDAFELPSASIQMKWEVITRIAMPVLVRSPFWLFAIYRIAHANLHRTQRKC